MADEAPKRGKGLRTGFSTGSVAAAAAKAAAIVLATGQAPAEVELDLPVGTRARFAVNSCTLEDGAGRASVIKDAGDDPDCTHGAEIFAEVRLLPEAGIRITGGQGIARATKAGVGIEVGSHSITKTPMKQIREAAMAGLGSLLDGQGAEGTIIVPKGEEMAKRTLNHRLGLIGGISILGTTGIVRPYSTAAYKVSIVQAIDVAIRDGCDEIVITTGGSSEKFAQRIFPLPEAAFVQMGDFVGFTLKHLERLKARKVNIVGMIGKLSKIADGVLQTHARHTAVNLDLLATIAGECGGTPELVERVAKANTAREAGDLGIAASLPGFFDRICERICHVARGHVNNAFTAETVLADHEGKLLGRHCEG